ncbi:MAG: ThiF family adenylyltransferase, partial [Tumebacillaceae bacterium]
VYLESESEVVFVYLSSRKRIKLTAHPALITSLSWLTGNHTVEELRDRVYELAKSEIPPDSFLKFIQYLQDRAIILSVDWLTNVNLPRQYKARLEKQLNFLLDVVNDVGKVSEVQNRIFQSKVAIFGVGGVGSWVCRELVMIGFRNFVLIDHDKVTPSDVARHAFFEQDKIGSLKTEVCESMLHSIDSEVSIKCINEPLSINTNLQELLEEVDFVVNVADEPYIGHTSLKLSRYCVNHLVPLFIVGGFDAHLGSLGEIIVPRVTPCADCYSTYFNEALRDWKPMQHPVSERREAFGGLASLAVFAASTAVMAILRYFIDPQGLFEGGRGELLFERYDITAFSVVRDAHCPVCGGTQING